MPKRASNGIPRDVNQNVARIVALSTGQPIPQNLAPKTEIGEEERKLRSQAASILGKLGGSKGGKARAKNLTPKQRTEIAKKGAVAKWQKYYSEQEHPR